MKETYELLERLMDIRDAHQLDNTKLNALKAEMQSAKVCVPIIGKFSTGKSALCNALLGHTSSFLQEDITPETAVPTELLYGSHESVAVTMQDGSVNTFPEISGYQENLNADTMKTVRVQLQNTFLKTIPDVMLVDMPGFDSGYELHNLAIDTYLPSSLAYLITFASNDMIIKNNMGNFLRELNSNDMPIGIVITKRNYVDDETLRANIDHLLISLEKYIGDRRVDICLTESHEGDVEEVIAFLNQIQENSQQILAKKFRAEISYYAKHTQTYLSDVKSKTGLSESDLAEREESLHRDMEELEQRLIPLSEEFDRKVKLCADQIVGDVSSALNSRTSSFVTTLMSKRSIDEQLNALVRTTVQSGYQQHFAPLVAQYLTTVNDKLEEIRVHTAMGIPVVEGEEGAVLGAAGVLAGGAVGAVAAPSAVAGLLAGGTIAIPGLAGISASALIPVIGPIIAGVSVLIAGLIIWSSKSKREEQKEELKAKLHGEVYPNVLRELTSSVSMELTAQSAKIKQAVQQDIATQREMLEKALEDVKALQQKEAQDRENKIETIETNLQQIGAMINGI